MILEIGFLGFDVVASGKFRIAAIREGLDLVCRFTTMSHCNLAIIFCLYFPEAHTWVLRMRSLLVKEPVHHMQGDSKLVTVARPCDVT